MGSTLKCGTMRHSRNGFHESALCYTIKESGLGKFQYEKSFRPSPHAEATMENVQSEHGRHHLARALKVVTKRSSRIGGLNLALTLAVLGLLGWNLALVSQGHHQRSHDQEDDKVWFLNFLIITSSSS